MANQALAVSAPLTALPTARPCPLCGKQPEVHFNGLVYLAQCLCDERAPLGHGFRASHAIEFWNSQVEDHVCQRGFFQREDPLAIRAAFYALARSLGQKPEFRPLPKEWAR